MLSTGFVWILIACLLYGALHSLLAAHSVKAWVTNRVGPAAYRRFYRLFFSVMGAITFLPVLALVALLPDRVIYRIQAPGVFITMVLQAIALAGIIIGVMQTGAMRFIGLAQLFEPANQPEQPDKLVVDGLYQWVRHPLYTCSFVLLWLAPVMSWNILALNLGVSAYFIIGSVYEERKLVQTFGEAYEEYRLRTPRLIPRIKINPRIKIKKT